MKKKIIVSLVVVIMGLILLGRGYLNNALAQAKETLVETMNINDLRQGTYRGSYQIAASTVDLEVTLEKGRVINIMILNHEYGLGKKAEAITQSVIQEQSLAVDAVSGATISSKTILKAIEKAMEKAQ